MNDRFRMLPSYHYEDNTDGMLLKSAGKPLREYKIEGNSVQDGTPTLDNPIEIESVGEWTKNIRRLTLSPVGNGSTYGLYENGFYGTTKINTGGYGNWVRISILSDFEWGKTYTFSCFVKQSNVDMNPNMRIGYQRNDNNTWVDFKGAKVVDNSINSITVTLPSEKPPYFGINEAGTLGSNSIMLFFNIQRNALDECGTIYVTDIMVNEGDTALPYEPVHPRNKYRVPITVSSDDKEPITTYIYLDEPLRKIGDYEEYADYIDFRNKKVVRNIGVYTFNGSEKASGTVKNDYVFGVAIYINNSSERIDEVPRKGLCNYLPQDNTNPFRSSFAFHNVQSHPYVYLMFSKAKFPDHEESAGSSSGAALKVIKELYDSGNPLELYYQLQIPTEEPIELPQIPTYKGTNIITVGTSLQPGAVNYQYYKGGK